MKSTGRPKTNIRTTKNLDWKTIDVEQTFDESAYAYLAKERITEAFEGGIHKTWNLGDTRKCFDRYQEGSLEPNEIEMEDDYLDSLDFIRDIDDRNIIVEKTQTKKLREGVGASYEFTVKGVKLEGIKILNIEDNYCEFTANIVPKEYEWEAKHYYWHINSEDDGCPLKFSGTVKGTMENSYSLVDYTEEDLIKDIEGDEYIITVTVGGGWVHTNLSSPVEASGNDIKSYYSSNNYVNVEFTDVAIYCDDFGDINDIIDDAIYGNDEEESDEEDSLEESSKRVPLKESSTDYFFTIENAKLDVIEITDVVEGNWDKDIYEECKFKASLVPGNYKWRLKGNGINLDSEKYNKVDSPITFDGYIEGTLEGGYGFDEDSYSKEFEDELYTISFPVDSFKDTLVITGVANYTKNGATSIEQRIPSWDTELKLNFNGSAESLNDAIQFESNRDTFDESSIPSIEKLIEEKKDNNAFFLVYNRKEDKFLSLDEDGGIVWLDREYAEIFKNRDEACSVLGDDCSNEDIAIVPVTVGDVLLEAVNRKIKENIRVERLNESQEKDIKVGFPIKVSEKGRIGVATAKRLLRFLAEEQMLKAGRTYFVMDSESNITAWDFAKSVTPGFDYEFSCEVADDDRDWYNCLYINRVAGKLDVKNSEWESYKVQ